MYVFKTNVRNKNMLNTNHDSKQQNPPCAYHPQMHDQLIIIEALVRVEDVRHVSNVRNKMLEMLLECSSVRETLETRTMMANSRILPAEIIPRCMTSSSSLKL